MSFSNWIKERGIGEIECLIPDLNGVLRGKVFPAQKFLQSERDGSLRIPSSIYLLTVTGEYADEADEAMSTQDPDVVLRPDIDTICVAPGYKTPTAFVFADTYHTSGEPYDIAPRYVLRRVLKLYEEMGVRPVVAPELEFYLTQVNTDPDLPLMPPAGRSGRSETSPQPYGLEAITEYEDLIETIYEHAELASLHLDTMIHESGTAQLEINFNHGDPVHVSDQVLVFKRIVRQVALKHGVYATFMAKPHENQPGSAMHLHVSLVDAKKGNNLFGSQSAEGAEANTEMFRNFVGGLQKYLGECTPLFAPNVNSFRRMRPDFSAPINLQWGYDNRSCGLRVPISQTENRRIENRLPGADANPYLAIAAVLACGYVGIRDKVAPAEMVQGSAYKWARTLPRTLREGLDRFKQCQPVIELLGEHFCTAFQMIKDHELSNFEGVISSWERDHLLPEGVSDGFNSGLGMERSYYVATANSFARAPKLDGEATADVVVIGGGYTGLHAALNAAERGYSVILLEAGRIGWGASGRNGGQAIPGWRKGATELVSRFGREHAKLLFELALDARSLTLERIAQHGFQCDLHVNGHLTLAAKPTDLSWMNEEAETLAGVMDYPHVRVLSATEAKAKVDSVDFHGGFLDECGGQLHPLNYALGLADAARAAGVMLHEDSRVVRIESAEGVVAHTESGVVRARFGVLACDALLEGLEPRIAGRIMPVANYLVATEPLPEPQKLIADHLAVSDSRFVVNYFRMTEDGRLLFGGGERYSPRPPADIEAFVRGHMASIFPQLRNVRIDNAWGGLVSISMTRLPHIGRMGDLFFAHGYSGQGVLLPALTGKVLVEAMAGTAERFDVLASIAPPEFPGGAALRSPLYVLGMLWYALRDRL